MCAKILAAIQENTAWDSARAVADIAAGSPETDGRVVLETVQF